VSGREIGNSFDWIRLGEKQPLIVGTIFFSFSVNRYN